MTLEQQVCSLELSKKLKSLGVKQESLFYWNELTDNPDGSKDIKCLDFKMAQSIKTWSAFTFSELFQIYSSEIIIPEGADNTANFIAGLLVDKLSAKM